MRLNYKLKTPEERLEEVTAQCGRRVRQAHSDESAQLTQRELSAAADYLLFVSDSGHTKKENRDIVTRARQTTIDHRETSLEGIQTSLSAGPDDFYNHILTDSDAVLCPKRENRAKNVPGIEERLAVIESLEAQMASARGKRRFSLKSQIIDTKKEIRAIRDSYDGSGTRRGAIRSMASEIAKVSLPESIVLDPDTQVPVPTGPLSLLRSADVFFLLYYYSALKQESYFRFDSDIRWLLLDLEDLVVRTLLPSYPLLYDLVTWEIDGLSGIEIVDRMTQTYGAVHSQQYYSSLWRKRIPRMVSDQARLEYIKWRYRYDPPEGAHWKVCTSCGRALPAHPYFFTSNTTADGFYSICRTCRKGAR